MQTSEFVHSNPFHSYSDQYQKEEEELRMQKNSLQKEIFEKTSVLDQRQSRLESIYKRRQTIDRIFSFCCAPLVSITAIVCSPCIAAYCIAKKCAEVDPLEVEQLDHNPGPKTTKDRIKQILDPRTGCCCATTPIDHSLAPERQEMGVKEIELGSLKLDLMEVIEKIQKVDKKKNRIMENLGKIKL